MMRKLAFLFCLIFFVWGFNCELKAIARSSDVDSLGQEQAEEKTDLEQMKQELNELKSNINERPCGTKKN